MIVPEISDSKVRRELLRRDTMEQFDLVGQAQSLQLPDAIIATTNVRHSERFFPADLWPNAAPT